VALSGLGLTAIKLVQIQMNGEIMAYSAGVSNTEEEGDIHGSSGTDSTIMECFSDAKKLMEKEIVNSRERLFIPSAK
jgi:uncharacterized protein YkvS